MILDGLTVLVTGGTGSLGNAVIRRLLTGELGRPRKVIVFSRDELKQHEMRLHWFQLSPPIEDLRNFSPREVLEFRIGDVRLYDSLLPALIASDIVINTAALKQVPACEYSPFEAVHTNIIGPYNLVRGIREHRLPIQKLITISTDKACKPVNVMGMTKAIQERLILAANLECPNTSFMAVRYGNVIASRGSLLPLLVDQLKSGGPLTITSQEMTRFLLPLDQAVDTIVEALKAGSPGETIVPKIPSARVIHIAQALIGSRDVGISIIGIRPGEKIHEIMISDEECRRTIEQNGYYRIVSILPEIGNDVNAPARKGEYSSNEDLLSLDAVRHLLVQNGFINPEEDPQMSDKMLGEKA